MVDTLFGERFASHIFFGMGFAQNRGWHTYGTLGRTNKPFKDNAVRGALKIEIELCNVGVIREVFAEM